MSSLPTMPASSRSFTLPGVPSIAQTSWNIVYLLISFPLGVIYFVLLGAGISLGAGLLVTLIGLPLLLLVLVASRLLALFEREMAVSWLGACIPPLTDPEPAAAGWWPRLRAHLANPVTWTSLAFLLLKLPLGLLAFTLLLTLGTLASGLIAAPFIYRLPGVSLSVPFGPGGPVRIETLPQALLCALAGLVIAFVTLYLVNVLALGYRRLAELALSGHWRRRCV